MSNVAGRRNVGIERNLAYKRVNELIFPPEIGPGTGEHDSIRLNMEKGYNGLLSEYFMIFIHILYVDMISPNYNTVQKLLSLADMAKEISIEGKNDKNVEQYRGFSKISSQIKKSAKVLENQLYFDNKFIDKKVTIYDMILYFSDTFKVNFEGILPTV